MTGALILWAAVMSYLVWRGVAYLWYIPLAGRPNRDVPLQFPWYLWLLFLPAPMSFIGFRKVIEPSTFVVVVSVAMMPAALGMVLYARAQADRALGTSEMRDRRTHYIGLAVTAMTGFIALTGWLF